MPMNMYVASESGNERENPKTMVPMPNSATVISRARPACLIGGKKISATAMISAPASKDAESRPYPPGPTFRMSLA